MIDLQAETVSNLRVYVEVNDKYLWTLRPFAYLFNIYWSSLQPVVVAGYSYPDFRLPENFVYHQISPVNYPADKWSDGMTEFLLSQPDEYFVLLLCDYWLNRTVDTRGVMACYDYVADRRNILRIDLTDDRLYAGGRYDVEPWGCYDIIETPPGTPYQMSTQAGIWNKSLILELLQPGKTAWEIEIHTSPPPTMRVLGTRQRPVSYANGINKGKIDNLEILKIPQPHRDEIKKMIPNGWSSS